LRARRTTERLFFQAERIVVHVLNQPDHAVLTRQAGGEALIVLPVGGGPDWSVRFEDAVDSGG
jgi:hypothetical protein